MLTSFGFGLVGLLGAPAHRGLAGHVQQLHLRCELFCWQPREQASVQRRTISSRRQRPRAAAWRLPSSMPRPLQSHSLEGER